MPVSLTLALTLTLNLNLTLNLTPPYQDMIGFTMCDLKDLITKCDLTLTLATTPILTVLSERD